MLSYLCASFQLLFEANSDKFYLENFAGIWAGMHTVRYFDGKTYEWVGISRQPNMLGKVCNEILNFVTRLCLEVSFCKSSY